MTDETLRQREPRVMDPRHLAKVRELPCCLRGMVFDGCLGMVHAHHVKTKGAFGSDKQTIPLCAIHHNEFHRSGVNTFARKYGLDYDKLIRETNEAVK